jgi:MFS family permease
MFLFIRRESKVSNPIFDLQILKQKPFMAANIYNFMHGVSTMGITSLLPLYGVTIYGLSTLESGLILTPRAIGMTIASAITSMFLMRWGYRRPILIGTIITGLVLFFLGVGASTNQLFGLNLTSVAILVLLLTFFGIAGGITQPAANNACIELMPDKVGTIMGIRGMFRMSGSAIGINTATLILHSTGSMAQGFQIIFAGFGIITLLMIPIILAMPRSPRVVKVSAPLE